MTENNPHDALVADINGGGVWGQPAESVASCLLARGWTHDELRTVSTAADLDALPLDAVILCPTPDGPIAMQRNLLVDGWLMVGGGQDHLSSTRIIGRAQQVQVLYVPTTGGREL